jgi:ubiquinone/menaquinone biosynthesis C-methylase UbiE
MQDDVSPVNRPREAARAVYNSMSRWYDMMAGSEAKYADMGLEMLTVQPGERVLEIGFGTGRSLIALARTVGESGSVRGVDISDGMLAVAQARVEKAGLSERVELTLDDAAALPYENAAFDAAFMAFTLELFDTLDIPLVLGECRRVLRQGGRMAVVSLSRQGGGRMVKVYEWAHRRWPAWIDCRPIYARQTLDAAGFAIANAARASMWGLPVEIVLGIKA